MHTPPHTKLKGDLMLELKEIRLEINKENSDLEEVRAKKKEAHDALSAVVKRKHEVESKLRADEHKASLALDKAKEELVDINAEVANRNVSIEIQNKTIATNNSEIDKQGIVLGKLLEHYDREVKSCDAVISGLTTKIETKYKELDEVNALVISAEKKLSSVNKECDNRIAEVEKRENEVSERETAVERKKSDLRTISVRLHQKYGKLLTEGELKKINI